MDSISNKICTFRESRERAQAGEQLKQTLCSCLRTHISEIDEEVPRLESALLCKLKEIGGAKTDSHSGHDYRAIRAERELCRQAEDLLDALADKKLKAADLLGRLESSSANGCKPSSFEALQTAVSHFEAGNTDTFFNDFDYSPILNTTEDIQNKATLTAIRSMTFSAGISCLCEDTSSPGKLFLGFTNGSVLRVSAFGGASSEENTKGEAKGSEAQNLTDPHNAEAYPGHVYGILMVKVVYIREQPYIASSSRDKCVKLVNIKTLQTACCLATHSGCVVDICVWDHVIYTTSLDGSVSHWHLARGTREGNLLVVQDKIHSASFVNDTELFIGTRTGELMKYSWDRASNTSDLMCNWRAHNGAVSCMAYSPQKLLFTGGVDSKIKMWDVIEDTSVQLIRTLEHHADTVLHIVSYDVQELLFSASADALVCIWDVKTGALTGVISNHFHHVTGLCFINTHTRPDTAMNVPKYTKLSALLDIPESLFEQSPAQPGSSHTARYSVEETARPVATPNDGLSRWEGAAHSVDDDVEGPRMSTTSFSEDGDEEKEATGSGEAGEERRDVTPDAPDTLVTVSNDKTMIVWEVVFG